MDKTTQLKSIIGLLQSSVTKQEFLDGFKQILKVATDLKKQNQTEWALINSAFQMFKANIEKTAKDELETTKQQITAESQKQLDLVVAKLASVQNGEDGEDGADAVVDYDKLAKMAAQYIPKPKDGYTPVKGKDYFDGAPGAAGSAGRTTVGWGAHPLNLYDSTGAVIDDVTRHIKFTGATLSRSPDGVVTVAVSSNGFTELAATETPNGSTTVFTFSGASAQPSYIVADNVWLKATSKAGTVNWTWNNGTKKATLTIPPNDEIYGIV